MGIETDQGSPKFSWKQLFDDIMSPSEGGGKFGMQYGQKGERDMSQPNNPALPMSAQGGQGPKGAPPLQIMQGGGMPPMPGPAGMMPPMTDPGAPNAMGPMQGLMAASGQGQQDPRQQMDPMAGMNEYLRGLMNV